MHGVDSLRFQKVIPRKNVLFLYFPVIPLRDSSPGLGTGPRGECPGLGLVPFWLGNFQYAEKKSTNLVVLAPSPPPPPLLRAHATPFERPFDCILYFRKQVLSFPRPHALQSAEQKADAIKGDGERGWPLIATRSDAEFQRKRLLNCCCLSCNLKRKLIISLMLSRTWVYYR